MPLTNPLFATYGRTPENNKRIFSSMRPQTSFEMSRMSGSSPQMASHSKRVVPWEVPPTHNPKGMTHERLRTTTQILRILPSCHYRAPRRKSNPSRSRITSRRHDCHSRSATTRPCAIRAKSGTDGSATCSSSAKRSALRNSGFCNWLCAQLGDEGGSPIHELIRLTPSHGGKPSIQFFAVVLVVMSGGFLFNRTSISWIWVDIRAQLVGGDLPADGFGNRDHHFGGRDFRLDAVQPAPDMHLADLGLRQPGPDTPRQRRLASGEFNGFLKGLA